MNFTSRVSLVDVYTSISCKGEGKGIKGGKGQRKKRIQQHTGDSVSLEKRTDEFLKC